MTAPPNLSPDSGSALSTPSSSPSRKRSRVQLIDHKTRLSSPPPRRLRARIDASQRIWAGRCGCKSPHCMADEFEFCSSESDSDAATSETSDESSAEDDDERQEQRESEPASQSDKHPPQDPSDLVPMLLHLMLMM